MKLGAMLREAGVDSNLPPRPEDSQPADPGQAQQPPEEEEREAPRAIDPFQLLKTRAQERLFRRLGSRLYDSSMSQDQLHTLVGQELDEAIKAESVPADARGASAPGDRGEGRHPRLRPDGAVPQPTPTSPRSWSTATTRSTSSAGKLAADRCPVRLQRPSAPGDRAHRLQGRSSHRRVVAHV